MTLPNLGRTSVLSLAALMAMPILAAKAANPALEAKSSNATQLEADVARQGWVRVIVQYAAAMPEAATISGESALEQARRGVSGGREAFLREMGTDNVRELRWNLRRFAHVPAVAMTVNQTELQALASNPKVVRISEDRLRRVFLDTSVPLVFAAKDGPAGATGSGKGTIVAVIDTGVDSSHPFLKDRVSHEACFSTTVTESGKEVLSSLCPNKQNTQTGTGSGIACSRDIAQCMHGTHVAGIIAGKRSGSDGPAAGVAPDARILAIQAFVKVNVPEICVNLGYAAGVCVGSLPSDQLAALDYLMGQAGKLGAPLAAINMSLGGGRHEQACDSDGATQAITALRAQGVLTVIAAGNNGYTDAIASPACISKSIAVGGTTVQDAMWAGTNMSPLVALLAPGHQINSATFAPEFRKASGTSMAAPHVAGAIAVLRAAHPKASAEEILKALVSTGQTISDGRTNGKTAAPRIRIDAASKALGAMAAAPVAADPARPDPQAPVALPPVAQPPVAPPPVAPPPAAAAQPAPPAQPVPAAGCKDPAQLATEALTSGENAQPSRACQ